MNNTIKTLSRMSPKSGLNMKAILVNAGRRLVDLLSGRNHTSKAPAVREPEEQPRSRGISNAQAQGTNSSGSTKPPKGPKITRKKGGKHDP
ncbi:hypothetical protein H2248_011981 [Termitomyces sp. 'cryptogamus']|nr:hypothetical protein H2248_011981 [Termitomyces sp. 'cryptogamus']